MAVSSGSGRAAVGVLLLAALAAVVPAHELLLPSAFGVLPQAVAAPLAPRVLYDVPAVVGLPGVAVDHVTPVLRAGSPAILLLPQTPSSGVYHLSDSHHQFPPFLEGVVNRVQNLFSSYVQVDPFHVPLATERPLPPSPTPSAAFSSSPSPAPDAVGPAAAIATSTTTVRTQGRGIDVNLLGPGGLPRDVELLDSRLQQLQRQVASAAGDHRQPSAFASTAAQQPGSGGAPDSYHPAAVDNAAVDEKPPAPATRPPSRRPYGTHGPYGPRVPPRRPPPPAAPADASYYRRP